MGAIEDWVRALVWEENVVTMLSLSWTIVEFFLTITI